MANYRKIYHAINLSVGLSFPSLTKIGREQNKARAKKIYNYLKEREGRLNHKCFHCEKKIARKEFSSYVFNSPFDKKGTELHFCSESCLNGFEDNEHGSYFGYHYCSECNRLVIERCPSNGWREYFGHYDGDSMCVGCIQELWMKEGLDPEKMDDPFVLEGDFMGQTELRKNGWKQGESYYVKTSKTAKEIMMKIAEDRKNDIGTIIDYVSMGIGGSEGHIWLWHKNIDIKKESKAA